MRRIGTDVHRDRQALDILHEGRVDPDAVTEEQLCQTQIERQDRGETVFLQHVLAESYAVHRPKHRTATHDILVDHEPLGIAERRLRTDDEHCLVGIKDIIGDW